MYVFEEIVSLCHFFIYFQIAYFLINVSVVLTLYSDVLSLVVYVLWPIDSKGHLEPRKENAKKKEESETIVDGYTIS